MLNPKKTIPKLAVGALALTGCGTDTTGGTGGTGGTGPDFAASVSAFCMNIAPECVPAYTAQDCIDYYNALNEYNGTESCTAALISYFDCAATKTCDELFVDDACGDYYTAADAACIDIPQQ